MSELWGKSMRAYVDLRLVSGVKPNFDYGKHLGLTEQEIVKGAELTLFEMESAYERQKVVHLDAESNSVIECECGRVFSKRKQGGVFKVKEEDQANYCKDCGVRLNWRYKRK